APACSYPAHLVVSASCSSPLCHLPSFPTRRSSDLAYAPPPVQDFGGWYLRGDIGMTNTQAKLHVNAYDRLPAGTAFNQYGHGFRSEEHTSELQSRFDLVCRLLLEKKNKCTTSNVSH